MDVFLCKTFNSSQISLLYSTVHVTVESKDILPIKNRLFPKGKMLSYLIFHTVKQKYKLIQPFELMFCLSNLYNIIFLWKDKEVMCNSFIYIILLPNFSYCFKFRKTNCNQSLNMNYTISF